MVTAEDKYQITILFFNMLEVLVYGVSCPFIPIASYLKGKEGLAMVPVRQNACGGCHLNLPPQVINEIQMKTELVFCESCARILYIEE